MLVLFEFLIISVLLKRNYLSRLITLWSKIHILSEIYDVELSRVIRISLSRFYMRQPDNLGLPTVRKYLLLGTKGLQEMINIQRLTYNQACPQVISSRPVIPSCLPRSPRGRPSGRGLEWWQQAFTISLTRPSSHVLRTLCLTVSWRSRKSDIPLSHAEYQCPVTNIK